MQRVQNKTKAALYAAIGVLFAFSLVYQWRSSRETIEYQQTYDFFVPFLPQPFTNRVVPGGVTPAGLHRGDELLAVNGHAFRGVSLYLRELWAAQNERAKVQNPQGLHVPLVITVRSGSSAARSMEVDFAHCTCGSPTTVAAIQIWLLPPMLCLLVAFTIVLVRPMAPLSWAFLVLLLSLSQLTPFPECYTGFQLTVNPLRWADWFRVPAIAYRAFFKNTWPAALLLFAAYFFYREGHVRQRVRLCSIPLLGFAVLQAALAISWSEDYAPFAAVFSFMSYYGKELMVAAFALVVLFGFHLGRACGLALATFACVAILALYWPDTRIIDVHLIYDSVSVRLDADVAPFHRPAGFIAAAFSAASFMPIAVVQRRRISRVEALSFAFLALPLVYVLMVSSDRWHFWQPLWMKLSLISAALGVAGIAWAVLDRTNPDHRLPTTVV